MNEHDANAIEAPKQPVEFTKALKSCLAPSAIIVLVLIAVLYAEVIFTANLEAIDAFFTLSIESLNGFLFFTYLTIFALAGSICICIKYENASNLKIWINVSVILGIIYAFLIFIFCNSYWDVEFMTAFQSNLSTFIWLPVWSFVLFIFFLLSEFTP